jgi:hypothetical protein
MATILRRMVVQIFRAIILALLIGCALELYKMNEPYRIADD